MHTTNTGRHTGHMGGNGGHMDTWTPRNKQSARQPATRTTNTQQRAHAPPTPTHPLPARSGPHLLVYRRLIAEAGQHLLLKGANGRVDRTRTGCRLAPRVLVALAAPTAARARPRAAGTTCTHTCGGTCTGPDSGGGALNTDVHGEAVGGGRRPAAAAAAATLTIVVAITATITTTVTVTVASASASRALTARHRARGTGTTLLRQGLGLGQPLHLPRLASRHQRGLLGPDDATRGVGRQRRKHRRDGGEGLVILPPATGCVANPVVRRLRRVQQRVTGGWCVHAPLLLVLARALPPAGAGCPRHRTHIVAALAAIRSPAALAATTGPRHLCAGTAAATTTTTTTIGATAATAAVAWCARGRSR